MTEPQFSHDPFDALLTDACFCAAQDDLVRAGLKRRPAPQKLLRVLLFAALLAALLTFGALAAWPELRLTQTGSRLALRADADGAPAAQADAEINFGPLPEGVQVSPVEARDGAVPSRRVCQITIGQDTYLLSKTLLNGTVFLEPGGNEDFLHRFQQSVKVFSGVHELTADDVTSGILCWPSSDAYYILVTAADKTTPRLIQFHILKNAVNPPFLGGFLFSPLWRHRQNGILARTDYTFWRYSVTIEKLSLQSRAIVKMYKNVRVRLKGLTLD